LKILILKPSSLGDVVQALPVLRAIKQHLPASEVYWWIDSRLAPLLQGDADLTGIIPFDRRQWATPACLASLWRNIRFLRDQELDWVIDLQCLARSGSFAWIVNGKLTVGLDEPREGARGFYDLIAPRPSYHTHAVDWYLGVLPLLGVPPARDLRWLPPRPGIAAAVRRQWPIEGSPWILLQPGARWSNKRWPAEHFVELIRQVASWRQDARFAILGGGEDRALGEAIARAKPSHCLDLTGRISLPEMVEWVRAGAIMLSNDTGPMHVAAALGTPLVALFGPTEPRRTGPYGQLDHVLQLALPCVPCMKSRCANSRAFECLRALSPATVFQAVQKRLAIPPPESI